MPPRRNIKACNRQAQNVCYACNSRKKACDKALPTCSFCAKRGLLCRYDITALDRRGRRVYNPGRNFVALHSEDPDPKTVACQVGRESKPSLLSILCDAGQSLDESVHEQVQQVIRLVGIPRDDISKRYFQTFHQWLPIVSPDLFHDAECRYSEGGSSAPPAEFSILRLAMYLIVTLSTLEANAPSPSRESLYTSVKLLFSRVQVAVRASLPLVQALLIIAMCEYAGARGEAAYVSIATCTGLARLLGIQRIPTDGCRDEILGQNIKLVDMERENVTWGLAILDRYDWIQKVRKRTTKSAKHTT
jgi:hypothetical protein